MWFFCIWISGYKRIGYVPFKGDLYRASLMRLDFFLSMDRSINTMKFLNFPVGYESVALKFIHSWISECKMVDVYGKGLMNGWYGIFNIP